MDILQLSGQQHLLLEFKNASLSAFFYIVQIFKLIVKTIKNTIFINFSLTTPLEYININQFTH